MIGQAGVYVRREPKNLFILDNTHQKPDLIARKLNPSSQKDTIFDVGVVNPQCYLDQGSATIVGVSANIYLRSKDNKYGKLPSAEIYESQQLIFECFGLFHPTVKKLVNYVCGLISSRIGVAFPIIKKYWTNRIFIANMRGTARMLLTASYQLAQKASVFDSRCFDVVDRSMGVFASTSGLGD